MNQASRQDEVLLKDGVAYIEHHYEDEAELEGMVYEHVGDIFGHPVLLFGKKKMKSRAGTGSVPDAFVMDLDRSIWFVVEVELASHPIYDHVVNQISKFRGGISSSGTLSALKRAFYEEIQEDPDKRVEFERRGITEVYKFVSDTLEKKPEVRVVIDGLSEEQVEALQALPFEAGATELKTYYRDGVVAQDHVHRFVPVHAGVRRIAPTAKDESVAKKEVEEPVGRKSSLNDKHRGNSITGFAFAGEHHRVKMWKELLLGVCEAIHAERKQDFDRILALHGTKRAWFSRTPEGMREPRIIGNSGVYAETHMSADSICRVTTKVLQLFGYSPTAVSLEEVG